jgi:DNA-binding response OmpR family regulator
VAPATILVVERDILVRQPLAQYLRDCGYRVLEAVNAVEARGAVSDSYVLGEINVSSVSRSPMRRRQRSRAELPQSKEWHIEGETHLANPGCI